MRLLRSCALVLACVAPFACTPKAKPDPAPAPAAAVKVAPAPIRLLIVGTNDLHGWLQPHDAKVADGTIVHEGGVAAFGGYLDRLRAEAPNAVLLLDAGDMFQGTLASNLSEGEAVIAAYNLLGYDAVAVGNHEFDYGPVGPKSAASLPTDDPFGALAARARQAKFPVLGRNIHLTAGGERPPWLLNDGTALLERNGVKVGIIGMTTPNTPTVTNPVNVATLSFTGLAEEARGAADGLRARGAEVVVAVVHAGGKCKSLEDPHSLKGCEPHSEIFDMLEALPEGTLDAVVAGHTHAQVGHLVKGTPVIESGSYGRRFGTVELTIDPATRRPVAAATKIRAALPICELVFEGSSECDPAAFKAGVKLLPATFDGAPIVPRADVAAVIAPYLDRVKEEQRRPLNATVAKTLLRDAHHESPLGNALADAVRAMEKSDVALLNSGGLRSDLPAGPLTYGALYEVFPFDNTIATLTVTGQELVELLEALLSGEHGVPQTSGVRFSAAICPGKAKIDKITLVNGKPLDPKKTYKLTTSDFLALGGDGLGPALKKIPEARKDLGHARDQNMRDALASWYSTKGGVMDGSADGRMTVSPAKGCE